MAIYLGKNDLEHRASVVVSNGIVPLPFIDNFFYNEKGDFVIVERIVEDEEKSWTKEHIIKRWNKSIIDYIYCIKDFARYKGFIYCENEKKLNTRRLYKKFLKAKKKLDLKPSDKSCFKYCRALHNYRQAAISDYRRANHGKEVIKGVYI